MPRKAIDQNNIIHRILKEKIDIVDVGWAVFNIEFKERIIEAGVECHGSVNFDDYAVRLDPKTPAPLALETVMHELIHIVTMGVGYGEDMEMSKLDNEDLTTQISRGLLQLYRLNPKLMALLSELMCNASPFKTEK